MPSPHTFKRLNTVVYSATQFLPRIKNNPYYINSMSSRFYCAPFNARTTTQKNYTSSDSILLLNQLRELSNTDYWLKWTDDQKNFIASAVVDYIITNPESIINDDNRDILLKFHALFSLRCMENCVSCVSFKDLAQGFAATIHHSINLKVGCLLPIRGIESNFYRDREKILELAKNEKSKDAENIIRLDKLHTILKKNIKY